MRQNNAIVLRNLSAWSASRTSAQNAEMFRENDNFSHELEVHLQESGFFDRP